MKGAAMTKPVRIGIVGCGSVMQRCYLPVIERLHQRGFAEVVAACDIEEDGQEFARGRGIPRVTDDYRTVIDSDDVDLVVILTAMRPHGQIARAALEAGKHVLVEKPMAVTLDEAAGLVE